MKVTRLQHSSRIKTVDETVEMICHCAEHRVKL